MRALRGCRVVTTSMTARLLLANQLRALGEVTWTVVSGDAFDDAPEDMRVEVVPVRREIAPSDVSAFFKLFALFRKQKFDFVQTHTPKASMLGLPAARLAGLKAVYTIHGSLYFADNDRIGNVAGWIFEAWCCMWANVVLLQSREDERVLPDVHICARRKLRYIGNGVVLDRFAEQVPPAMTDSVPIVAMVSRLVKEKGCSDFFELARRLSSKARFVHIGPKELDQSDAVSDEELEMASKHVVFVGGVDDIRPYLAAADIVVLPSYREGIPRVVMEAAAAGKAVVAYDIRGVREVVDRETGLLVPRGDEAALTKAVSSLIDDPSRRAKLGAMCRERVMELFSEDEVIERLRSVYSELGGGR